MSKSIKKEILGFTVLVVGVAESLKEAVELAGSEEVVLNDFNNQVLFHSHYTGLREKIVSKLAELTGIPRLTEKKGDKDVIVEKDAEYIARLESQIGEDGLKAHESAIAELVAGIPVDYKPGTRGTGTSGVPAKKWMAVYGQLKTEGKLDAFAAKYSVTLTGDEEADTILIAHKAKEVVDAIQKAASQQAFAV
jgi:hypothetical protein